MEENKKQEWLLPQDIVKYETSEPKEMLNKYLAKPVVKKWTEDFIDEDTKEIVSTERSEILFPAGRLIDQDLLVKINFALQCGDIKSVWVSERIMQSQRQPLHSAHIVKVTDKDGTHDIYVAGCDTTDDAAQIVSDYLSVYGAPMVSSVDFSISETKITDKRLLEMDDLKPGTQECIDIEKNVVLQSKAVNLEDEVPLPEIMEMEESWYIKVTRWTANTFEKKWNKDNYTFIVMADFFEAAFDFFTDYSREKYAFTNTVWEIKSISKGTVEFVIPMDYIKSWKEKHYAEEGK